MILTVKKVTFWRREVAGELVRNLGNGVEGHQCVEVSYCDAK